MFLFWVIWILVVAYMLIGSMYYIREDQDETIIVLWPLKVLSEIGEGSQGGE